MVDTTRLPPGWLATNLPQLESETTIQGCPNGCYSLGEAAAKLNKRPAEGLMYWVSQLY
jgi:hypothetical protein